MHSHHDHSHGHGHAQHFDTHNRSFALAVVLNVVFVAIEAVYGVLSGSLALLADAGHNLSDVLGLVMAWVASWLATQEATDRNTYGLKKSTILAALFNALFLIAAVGGIAWEAIGRFNEPAEVTGLTVSFKIRLFGHTKQVEAPAKLHCVRVDIVTTIKLIDAIWTGDKNT